MDRSEQQPKGQLEVPHVQPLLNDVQKTVTLSAQLERVKMGWALPNGNPVHELEELDAMFVDQGLPTDFVDTAARQLFEQPHVLENINFQSSLLTGGSQFFGAVLRKMGELAEQDPQLAEGAALPVKIRLVEHYRRGGNESEMQRFAREVEDELQERVDRNDPLALGQLAKVRYEQSMFEFAQDKFESSMAVGEESIQLCARAGDTYGVLAARGNTAGLCRYTLAKKRGEHPDNEHLLNEGKTLLLSDLAIAQKKMKLTEAGSSQHRNFTRVEMNNAAHLMQIANLQNDLSAARGAMEILKQNPVFQSAFDPEHPGDYAHAQEWVRPYPEILRRLEELE
ncbi:MAG: hypothetical protein WCX61_02280 [Candidatus Peribacteraceae bacterium]